MVPELPYRRQLLNTPGLGMGSVALGALLAEMGLTPPAVAQDAPDNLLAPKPAHFPGIAKRVIHLLMNGGPAQIDAFGPQPAIA